jgi:hypothetical protein
MAKVKESKSHDMSKVLKDTLIDYVNNKRKRPHFIFRVVDHAGLVGVDFYDHYASLRELEGDVWRDLVTDTVERLHSDPIFVEYSSREKLLAFYFTLIEVLKEHEVFSRVYLKKAQYFPLPAYLKEFKSAYMRFIGSVLAQGKQDGEVVDRLIVSDQYDQVIWLQLMFVLKFWASDQSEDYQKTDAAIEKAVNTLYDLIGRNPVDSLFDLGKFIYQNRNLKHFL